jgi:anti-sigma factor RsiW
MNRRDIELLSSYLDGQLKPSDSARLEARLTSDSDLRAVLDDLRAARGLLRQLPMRKAPRNFTLTPKMVGKNPPLPRSYSAFRFVTALASLMLFFTLGLNFVVPQLSQPQAFGFGGGGAPEISSAEQAQAPAVPEAAATEPPATEAPAEEPSVLLAPPPTATISPAADSAVREAETPDEKQGVTNEADVVEQPQQPPLSPPVPPTWQIVLAAIAALGALVMVVMRQAAANRWRRK